MSSPIPAYIFGVVISVALLAASVYIVLRRRLSPSERERRRRLKLNRHQRTTEALLTECGPELLHYEYELRGVFYSASQDVRGLRALLPVDPTRLIGAVSVKYDPRNPANSIVLCEEWSGIPAKKENKNAVYN